MSDPPETYVVECFWPGVDARSVDALNVRSAAAAQGLAADGQFVRIIRSTRSPQTR